MSGTVRDAIVLAAGMGTRLRAVVDDRPKGLVEIDGETLVGRSLRLLRRHGIDSITIVIGHRADHYEQLAAGQAGVRLVTNDAFATTGSMASLDVALAAIDPDAMLVLESDIAFEARALDALLDGPPDATLVSGPTGAGDEVWVDAPGGRLRGMSKIAHDLPGVDGEFVGITRLSRSAASAMRGAFARFVARHGHARMSYETDALVEVARGQSVGATMLADLCWGEIDDDRQLDRVRRLWPDLGSHRR